jgi:hypothetical protein
MGGKAAESSTEQQVEPLHMFEASQSNPSQDDQGPSVRFLAVI